jgi:hypothetical protein
VLFVDERPAAGEACSDSVSVSAVAAMANPEQQGEADFVFEVPARVHVHVQSDRLLELQQQSISELLQRDRQSCGSEACELIGGTACFGTTAGGGGELSCVFFLRAADTPIAQQQSREETPSSKARLISSSRFRPASMSTSSPTVFSSSSSKLVSWSAGLLALAQLLEEEANCLASSSWGQQTDGEEQASSSWLLAWLSLQRRIGLVDEPAHLRFVETPFTLAKRNALTKRAAAETETLANTVVRVVVVCVAERGGPAVARLVGSSSG